MGHGNRVGISRPALDVRVPSRPAVCLTRGLNVRGGCIRSRKAIGVAVYHRTKAEPEWNASFPPTALSAITSPSLASDSLPSSPTAGCMII